MDSISDELKTKVVKQLEYYFSDLNLIRNSFIKELTLKDSGWIDLNTLLTFNRLKQLVNNNKDLLTNVLKNSNSDLIELNSNESKIRRKVDKPMPEMSEEFRRALNERTVHVKGFPEDMSLEKAIEWSEQYGSVESVQMRYWKSDKQLNVFKGCVFVTYTTKSMADNVINESVLKYEDKELLKENKIKYFERKRDFFEEKKRKKREERVGRPEERLAIECGGAKPKVKEVDPIGVQLAILKLKGWPKRMAFIKIINYFNRFSKVVFVNKVNSKGICFVRFGHKLAANAVLNNTRITSDAEDVQKVVIEGIELIAEVLTGEEEKRYWIKNNRKAKIYQKRKEIAKNHKKDAKPVKKGIPSSEPVVTH